MRELLSSRTGERARSDAIKNNDNRNTGAHSIIFLPNLLVSEGGTLAAPLNVAAIPWKASAMSFRLSFLNLGLNLGLNSRTTDSCRSPSSLLLLCLAEELS